MKRIAVREKRGNVSRQGLKDPGSKPFYSIRWSSVFSRLLQNEKVGLYDL